MAKSDKEILEDVKEDLTNSNLPPFTAAYLMRLVDRDIKLLTQESKT